MNRPRRRRVTPRVSEHTRGNTPSPSVAWVCVGGNRAGVRDRNRVALVGARVYHVTDRRIPHVYWHRPERSSMNGPKVNGRSTTTCFCRHFIARLNDFNNNDVCRRNGCRSPYIMSAHVYKSPLFKIIRLTKISAPQKAPRIGVRSSNEKTAL